MRSSKADYDAWADLVKDQRWNYEGQLPYFRRTEHHYDNSQDTTSHGFDGPVFTASVSSSSRKYPLRSQVRNAWLEIGLPEITDMNGGSPFGFGDVVENRRNGDRQVASTTYSLDRVHVMTETLVSRVIFEEKSAKGIRLANGTSIRARHEVILSAGAVRTPQILLLSGIGGTEELSSHGIEQIVDLP